MAACRNRSVPFVKWAQGRPNWLAVTGRPYVTKYLISFNDGDMSFPQEDLPEVARAARAVVKDAQDAGVFVFAGGLGEPSKASVVGIDGTVTEGPKAMTQDFIGGFTVVDVPTRQAALEWA